MSRRTRALLLNALVLPGLGQLYLGRKVTGLILIMVVNLLLLLALFVLLKAAAPIIALKMTAAPVTHNDLVTALGAVAGFGKAVLAVFFAIWGFALLDVLKHHDEA